MTPAILVVVLAVVVLRTWLRRRGASTGRRSLSPSRGTILPGEVGLVATREIRERVRGRIFRVGTVLILGVVAAAIVIPVLNHSKERPQEIGAVGAVSAPIHATIIATAREVGTTVHLVQEASVAEAQSDLRSGRLDLAVVDSRELMVDKAFSDTDTSTSAQLVLALSKALGVANAFEEAGLTPTQAATLTHIKPLPITSLQPGSPKGTVHSTSLVGLILVFIMLTQYLTWILTGVMEEKSSRVVEVLLAAVRPFQLLAGKVLGIGLVAFAQAALIVGFALGLARAVGSNLLQGTAPLVLVTTLVWLVLGYAFYCWVYAAAGSLAERQDQIQTLAFPLSLPLIFGYVIALTVASTGNSSTFFDVLAYLPPTAPFAMPVLVALGKTTWWGFTISAALSVASTVIVARLAAGVYRRAILRTGRRVKIRDLIGASSSGP